MGAIPFVHTIDAYDASTAFANLVDEAIMDAGDRSYNGTISTCSMGHVRKIASVYTKKLDREASKIIENEDGGKKWVASVLDLGVVGYDVITSKKVIPNTTKKAEFKVKFAVVYNPPTYPIQEKCVTFCDTKVEADKKALDFSLLHPNNKYYVVKRPVNVNNGDDVVSEFKVDVARKKTPPTDAKNRTSKPVHRYVFYGWASC